MRASGMRRSSKQFGRGSSKHFDDARGDTPEKKGMKGSIKNITRQIDFDPKEYIVAECSEHDIEVFKHVFDFLGVRYSPLVVGVNSVNAGFGLNSTLASQLLIADLTQKIAAPQQLHQRSTRSRRSPGLS